MNYRDLFSKLEDRPFQPFRVRLSNNTTIDVLDPHAIAVGASSAIMPMEYSYDEDGYYVVKRWRTVALAHMAEFVDIDPPKASRKKRAS